MERVGMVRGTYQGRVVYWRFSGPALQTQAKFAREHAVTDVLCLIMFNDLYAFR